MRTLCLDVGEKRIGVAVTDAMDLTAQGVETIQNAGFKKVLARIEELCAMYATRTIVVGLPRNMDGTEGFQAEAVRAFARKLSVRGFDIRFQDERMTTKLARDALIQGDVRRERRKDSIDMLAATYILETYIAARDARPAAKKFTGGIYRMSDIEKNLPNEMEEGIEEGLEQDENIVELVDEDGNEVVFEHLMSLEHKGRTYICLAPAEPMEDVAEDELVIMRIETDEEGNDYYTTIDDEEELNEAFEQYLALAEADED
ncbi:MAG: Holliday junction resolvase RuvX [Clostridiales bacterium]|nr:Holliday junction resolvase RuvX [Clostridiales bacterium]